MTNETLLSVRDLVVHFGSTGGREQGPVHAVDGVSLSLSWGGALAIVGESGSGKTTIARALLGLHPRGAAQGSICWKGRELQGLSEEEWRSLRWRHIAMAVQGAGNAFDPVYRIGEQIAEPMREHLGLGREQALDRAIALAERLGLERRHLRAYPHQLSGGEKQRAMMAMALSCDPELLIADEPTSGQDVLSRARLIDMLQDLRSELGFSLLLITHDLAAAAQLAEEVGVLYAGKLIEMGCTQDILEQPRHPYSWGLLNAYPNMTTTRDLRGIRGASPDPSAPPPGCRFHPRCTQAVARCREVEPPLVQVKGRRLACHLGGLRTLLKASNVRKSFSRNGQGETVTAVHGASLEVYEGEVVALVGETGSGKTTLGRLLVGLLSADGGRIEFEGRDLAALSKHELRAVRRRIQFIAQDPFDAVSPRLTVAEIVREPLDVQKLGTAAEREDRVRDALRAVGLSVSTAMLTQCAHELSGGQLQRVAIARALVLEPKLIVADEPVSMLDASEQAKVIVLLKEIQNERGMGLLLVSHDLALVRKVADRILVMCQGEIIESGPANRVVAWPQHVYTRSLLQAAPSLDWRRQEP